MMTTFRISIASLVLSSTFFSGDCRLHPESAFQHKSDENADATTDCKVFSWLSKKPGFFFHPSLTMMSGDFIVKGEIEQSAILMEIPLSAVLSPADEGTSHSSKDTICRLFDVLLKEVELRDGSSYRPYIDELVDIHKHRHSSIPSKSPTVLASGMAMPSTWSHTGRRLLTMVNNGSPQDEIVKLLDEYSDCLVDKEETKRMQEDDSDDDSDDESHDDLDYDSDSDDDEEEVLSKPPPFVELPRKNNKAVELSEEEKQWKRTLEITLQHQVDRQMFVPLYDQVHHHHYDYNIVHQHRVEKGVIQVVATRSLKPGDTLTRPSQTCLKDCNEKSAARPDIAGTMIGALKLYGQVQRYPHYWSFQTGISFVYHGRHDDLDEEDLLVISNQQQQEEEESFSSPRIEWIEGPTEGWQLDYMETEVARQLKLYEVEVVRSNETVPSTEWMQVSLYSSVTRSALTLAVSEGRNILLRDRNEVIQDISRPALVQALLDSLPGPSTKRANWTGYIDSEDSVKSDCDQLKDCSYDEIKDLRGCSASTYTTSIPRNASEWHLIRKTYVDTVGPEKATIQATNGSGFKVQYKVAHSPGRGRGVFATENIPKGSLLWTTDYTAWFDQGYQFRQFLAPLPDDVVCDLVKWCYTCVLPDGPTVKHWIGCDLDDGSLFNSNDNAAEYNAGMVDITQLEVYSNLDASMYAMRNILEGEELVTAYDEFDTDNYTALGL